MSTEIRNVGDALAPGVRILPRPDGIPEAEGDVMLSSGIGEALKLHERLHYSTPAFVPVEPWRPPTESERRFLTGDVEREAPGRWIQVFCPPVEALAPFHTLWSASLTLTHSDELCRFIDGRYAEAVSSAARFLASLTFDPSVALDGVGIFVNPPGLATTTRGRDSLFVGLHVDNWYPVGMRRRSISPNRVTLNLGAFDRYFLFVNLTIQQIALLLQAHGIDYLMNEISTHSLRNSFMSSFPKYPVVRLRVRPGEAFIAPTENVIHDGSTSGQLGFDVRLSARGHFIPLRKPPVPSAS